MKRYKIKLCPKCGANVTGLIHHCDCCSALLNPIKKFVFYGVHEAACDASRYIDIAMDLIENIEYEQYAPFLTEVSMYFDCFPDAVCFLANIKLDNRVRYSKTHKNATVTTFIEYVPFINAEPKEKQRLVNAVIINAFEMLNNRLMKSKYSIEDFLVKVREILSKS